MCVRNGVSMRKMKEYKGKQKQAQTKGDPTNYRKGLHSKRIRLRA